AVIARDGIPVDHIRRIAILKKSHRSRTTGRTRISRRNMRRAGTPDVVVPLRDSLARRDGKKQTATWIDVVVFEVDALQPRVIPINPSGWDNPSRHPFFFTPAPPADERLMVICNCFQNEPPVFQ